MQLAQASTFAAYLGTVVETDIPKPTDVLRHLHGLIPVQYNNVTMPRPPSTRIRWPSLIFEVALPVPTTAGSPYSRATMAAWLMEPPMSVTAARIFCKLGVHGGFVTWQTRISP